MKRITTFLLIAMAVCWTGVANATDLNVPGTYATIAAAITAAADGDRIVLAEGTYTENNLDLGGKSLTIEGAGIASTTVQAYTSATGINGSSTNTLGVFKITAISSAKTVSFSGLTIQNGSFTSGGSGVYVGSGTTNLLTLTFENVKFKDNLSNANSVYGGAIYLNSKADVTINNCIFTGNKNKYNGGGGAIAIGTSGPSTLSINECFFENNLSGNKGGGAICNINGTNPIAINIRNSTFSGNQTSVTNGVVKGGAINVSAGATFGTNTLFIENSTFYNNKATYAGSVGGAIYYSANSSGATSNITINHSTIYANTSNAGTGGDGVCINSGSAGQTNLIINNSVIIGNTGSTSNQSDVGTNAADQSKINAVGASGSSVTNSILTVCSGNLWGGTAGPTNLGTGSYDNHNRTTTVVGDLAFGTLTGNATPVLPIGNASIARNYVTTNYLSPALTTDQIGQPRVNATDAGAYENQLIQYTISATAGTGGTISAGAGDYDNGASCTVVASANTGYDFVNWTESGIEVSTYLSYTFTVSASRTLVANFAASATPELTLSTTSLSGFKYTPENGPSTEQSFTLTAANLSGDVTVTAPADYEVSATSGTGFSTTAIITPSSGSLSDVPVYVRLKSGFSANTAYNDESVSVTTNGVAEQTVSCSGLVTDIKPTIAATNAIASNTLHYNTDLSWTAGDGTKFLVLVSTNSNVATAYPPVAGSTYIAGNTTHEGYTVGYVGGATTANVSGLTAGTTNYLAVFTFNDNSGTSGYENYMTTTPAETNVTTIIASNASDYFKTYTDGTWSSASTVWQSSTNGTDGWHKSDLIPGNTATKVTISTGNTITVETSPTATALTMEDGATLTASANGVTIPATTFNGTTTSVSGNTYSNFAINGMNAGNGVSVNLSTGFNHANNTDVAMNIVPAGTLLSGSEVNVNGTGTDNRIGLTASATTYLSNTKLNLKGTAMLFLNVNTGGSTTINLASLTGETGTRLGWQKTSGLDRSVTWSVGASNESTTFAGSITNTGGYAGSGASYLGNYTHLTKVGTGTLTLSGTSTGYNGNLTVNDGELLISGTHQGNNQATTPLPNTVTVAAGKKLTVTGSLTATNLVLNSDVNGTATLVNTGTVSITNPVTVNQHLASARNWYIASPVTGATVPTGYTFYGYDETGGNASRLYDFETAYWKGYPVGTTLTPGKGYIAIAAAAATIGFQGTLNSTPAITLTRRGAAKTGYNLVGNPYPAYLDAQSLLTANSSDVEANIWFRTHTGSAYQFQTYNASGNESVPLAANPSYIPPMQGFWVRALTDNAELNFSNAMTKHNQSGGSILLRTPAANEVQRIRLQISNGINTDETLIYANEMAANDYDRFDTRKMSNDNVAIPEIYSVLNNEMLVINGYNVLPVNQEIIIGMKTGTSGSFTLKASEINNIDESTQLLLLDKQLNTQTTLNDEVAYTFSSDATNTTGRFSLILKSNEATTGVQNNGTQTKIFSNLQQQLIIDGAQAGQTWSISNAIGQQIAAGLINSQHEVIGKQLNPGLYIVVVNKTVNRIIIR